MRLLDGKKLSNLVKDNLKSRIDRLKQIGIQPGLGVILVGDKVDSATYVRMKQKACERLGIHSILKKFPVDIEQDRLIEEIKEMNVNINIHGILIQLPLPKHINTEYVLEQVNYKKDVDGFHSMNAGKLSQNRNALFNPCTPRGCMNLLEHYEIDVKGMNAVIIGCSNLVGLPISLMLLHKRATVTICNSQTKNTKELCQKADLIVACCGVTHLVKEDWVKEGVVIIDVGINSLPDETRKRGYRLVGDVDFENIKEKASYITPVPGGVGPMTIATLMKQTVESAELMMTR